MNVVFTVEVTWLDARLKNQLGYTEEGLVSLDADWTELEPADHWYSVHGDWSAYANRNKRR